ncbi:MAG: endonuclease III [Thermomicrobiales bacterium]
MKTSESVALVLDRLKDAHGEPARRSSGDPIRGLVGTILSQNTSDVNSSRALNELTDAFPSWDDVLEADLSDIEDAIRSGGLATQKAPTIKRALSAIKERGPNVDGRFLDDLDDDEAMSFLTGIKGVGQKTAACVLMFDLERDVLPVDTHVHRVTGRIGFVPESATANKTQHLLEEQIAPEDRYAAHILFIRHGRTICRARNPRCDECVVADVCEYASENLERIA